MNKKNKKKEIEKILEEQNYANDVLIYKLLKKGHLDNLISKLDNEKAICNFNCLVKKGYLTAEEQFISLLDNFIVHLNATFSTIEYTYIYMMLEEMIKSKYCDIFFAKHYWGNNDYLKEYRMEFDKIIIDPFINNLSYLSQKYYDTSLAKTIKNIITKEKNINLDNPETVDNTITFLKNVLSSNPEHLHFSAMYLFISIENHIASIQNEQKNITAPKEKEIETSMLAFFNDTWNRLYENYLTKMKK